MFIGLLSFLLGLVQTHAALTDAPACAASDMSEASNYLSKFDQYTLTYFDGRGLAEVSRTLFATTGRFPQDGGFTDVRLSQDDFDTMRGKGDLAQNLNRVPVLRHNDAIIGQSSTIARYLARKFNLLGKDEVEAAKIDALCEHIEDIKSAWRKIFPYPGSKNFTKVEKDKGYAIWFETPPAPKMDGRKERQLQWFLQQMEQELDETGYSVGMRPSLSDAYLYNLLGEQAPELGAKGEGWFLNRLATDRILNMFPKLAAVVRTFGESPGMRHWKIVRGDQNW